MAVNTVLRDNIVPPFSVRTPLIKRTSVKANRNGDKDEPGSGVDWVHVKFFQSLTNAANNSVQLTAKIPANSNSLGQAGTEVYDPVANILYKCISANHWVKFTGTLF